MLKHLATGLLVGSVIYAGPFLPSPWLWPKWVCQRWMPRRKERHDSVALESTLSVVIPVYNETAERLTNTLTSVEQSTEQTVELIVVDGGCTDDTMDALDKFPWVKRVQTTGKGRGPALNTGAEHATGDYLLFLHADTRLPHHFDTLLKTQLADPNTLMTAFSFAIDRSTLQTQATNALELGFRWIESSANKRSHVLWLPYGDQAFAMSRASFDRLGRFPSYKMMEDFELVQRARILAIEQGLVVKTLPQRAFCSSRRWETNGIIMNTALNWLFVAAYVWGGKSPDWIFERYYQSSK